MSCGWKVLQTAMQNSTKTCDALGVLGYEFVHIATFQASAAVQLRFSLFWDVTRANLDVSEQHIVHIFKDLPTYGS